MSVCIVCHAEAEMSKGGHGKLRNVCKPCWNKQQRAWRHKNPEKWSALKKKYYNEDRKDPEWVASNRKRGREYWALLRNQAIMAYGGYSCACCGETEPLFLSIDHIENNGAQHRREVKCGGNQGSNFSKWLKDAGYPKGFQVLCMNCNFGKFMNKGVCPHKNTCVPEMTGITIGVLTER